MSKKIENIIDELIDQYQEDDRYNRPWIIGFSGGKDSTVLQTIQKAAKEQQLPIIVKTTTPQIEDTFWCWICTVVKEDKSMSALIKNGVDWMKKYGLQTDLEAGLDSYVKEVAA
jgi:3'-phosphoadenosine 5'-phosphosulfate sulfotransferase (PAPS reductase)/FAD synthetase